MKTMTTKAMELVNKVNDLMAVDIIRSSVMNLFDLEVEALALILLVKYAMFATTIIGSRGAVIVASILVAANFTIRLVAAIKAVPESVRAYKNWKAEYDRFNSWHEKLDAAVRAAMNNSEEKEER